MVSKKGLIIYMSCGYGHEKAAQALAEGLEDVCWVDLLDYTLPIFKEIYRKSYKIVVNKIPWLWKLVYYLTYQKVFIKAINLFHKIIFYKFNLHLGHSHYQYLITTHFFPVNFIAEGKDSSVFTCVVITDFTVHPFWVDSRIDRYLVGDKKVKKELIGLGIKPDKIYITGIPLRKDFYLALDKQKVKSKFNFTKPYSLLVLWNPGLNLAFLRQIINYYSPEWNVIFIAVPQKIIWILKKGGYIKEGIVFLPFYEKLWELLAVADVVVGKPGGLLSQEIIFMDKFFIATYFIPGQEEKNLNFLISKQAGYYAANFYQFKNIIDKNYNPGYTISRELTKPDIKKIINLAQGN